jgi:UDP-N-acetylglucosamine 1-carboxyvinyltransferase
MAALQCVASGTSVIEETVFENRMLHVPELQKMNATIDVHANKATITGVKYLEGTSVIAPDIRACCALVLAGLVARGTTIIHGVHHWQRGHDALEKRFALLGADVALIKENDMGSHIEDVDQYGVRVTF